jgi:hypothetical protein
MSPTLSARLSLCSLLWLLSPSLRLIISKLAATQCQPISPDLLLNSATSSLKHSITLEGLAGPRRRPSGGCLLCRFRRWPWTFERESCFTRPNLPGKPYNPVERQNFFATLLESGLPISGKNEYTSSGETLQSNRGFPKFTTVNKTCLPPLASPRPTHLSIP